MGRPEAGAHLIEDRSRDPVAVLKHVIVPEPDHLPSQLGKAAGSLLILYRIDVLASIEFDCELRAAAGKVNYVVADDVLAREARAIRAENPPQGSLCVSPVAAKPARIGSQFRRHSRHSAA